MGSIRKITRNYRLALPELREFGVKPYEKLEVLYIRRNNDGTITIYLQRVPANGSETTRRKTVSSKTNAGNTT